LRPAVLIASAVAAAIVGAAPAAAQDWKTQRLTGESGALAGNERGDAVLAVQRAGRVLIARARRGGAFGAPRTIRGSRGAVQPRVAIDSTGTALVFWNYFDGTETEEEVGAYDVPCCRGVKVAIVGSSGHVRRVQTLMRRGIEIYAVEAFSVAAGRVAVAWTTGANHYVRVAGRGRRLGPPVRLRTEGDVVAVTPTARGPDVTLALSEGDGKRIVEYRVRRGRLGRARELASVVDGYGVAVAANERGDQVAAWGSSGTSIFIATRRRSERFEVHEVAHAARVYTMPTVAIAPSGAGVAAWENGGGQIVAAGSLPGQPFGEAREFFSGGGDRTVGQLSLAVNSTGRALISFPRDPLSGEPTIWAAFRSRRGARFGLHDFGAANEYGAPPEGAVDARGRARLSWLSQGFVRAARSG
jgi:hypothetical protein